MAFLIGGANSSAVTAYDIENSLRFNDGDSPYLTFTPSGAGNRKTFTISCWVKLSKINVWQTIFSGGDDGNNLTRLKIDDDTGHLFFDNLNGGSSNARFYTATIFRDPSAWYHIVVAVDTEQGTTADRVNIYINGVKETSFGTANYPAEDLEYELNTAEPHEIGKQIGDRKSVV